MDGNPKQSIVERIKTATNILVTVSRDPTVDELAAALGFTLMLNKMDKHATAVFSGVIPPAINFLEPAKTFENTVDSLRDFIIALDKEKADRLRYKVEDDVVRIFITPYRTIISQADLNFSQGDFNVELVVALGVEKKDDLDAAITAHGRILHDATVVTINAKLEKSSLGSIDWNDSNASSLCEMLMSLSEALQSGLLDEQIASSLLTGIVASTERFSNTRTSPKVMTMAAQLMAAGANQQLIASRLEEGNALPAPVAKVPSDGSTPLQEGGSEKLKKDDVVTTQSEPSSAQKVDGEMTVPHNQEHGSVLPAASLEETHSDILPSPSETELSDSLEIHLPPTEPTLSVSDLQKDLEAANHEIESVISSPAPIVQSENTNASEPLIGKAKSSDWRGKVVEPPSMGGSLSATANEAEAAKLQEENSDRNHTILSHDGPANGSQSINGPSEEPPTVDPFADPMSYEETAASASTSSKQRTIMPLGTADTTSPNAVTQPHTPTLEELEAQAHAQADPAPEVASTLDDARAAVDAALGAVPALAADPTPLPPPSFGVPLADHAPSGYGVSNPALPPPPPMPDFSTLPPLPPVPPTLGEVPQAPHPAADTNPQFPMTSEEPAKTDPGQFKIPGQ